MKKFCFTVDDNIRFLKELSSGEYSSMFDHPYLALYKKLHEKYALCVQLNLFYECDGFGLSLMSDRYRAEWEKNADWLKLSFHSRLENVRPYENSGYDEVFADCSAVHREILRFASESSLAKTTTVHYCLATHDGLHALRDCGVSGLLGLYGSAREPRTSYQTSTLCAGILRRGDILHDGGIAYAAIDVILNLHTKEEILARLGTMRERSAIKIMIHEQYFYEDYFAYQPDFAEKLDATFKYLCSNGFKSRFFEDII